MEIKGKEEISCKHCNEEIEAGENDSKMNEVCIACYYSLDEVCSDCGELIEERGGRAKPLFECECESCTRSDCDECYKATECYERNAKEIREKEELKREERYELFKISKQVKALLKHEGVNYSREYSEQDESLNYYLFESWEKKEDWNFRSKISIRFFPEPELIGSTPNLTLGRFEEEQKLTQKHLKLMGDFF